MCQQNRDKFKLLPKQVYKSSFSAIHSDYSIANWLYYKPKTKTEKKKKQQYKNKAFICANHGLVVNFVMRKCMFFLRHQLRNALI